MQDHHDTHPVITAEEIIEMLGMKPLPVEGGYVSETFREGRLPPEAIAFQPQEHRSLKTAIYYLLTPTERSAMHVLPGTEVFHFYLGDPVRQLHLFPDGTGRIVTIGPGLQLGERPQMVVPGGVWQGARLLPGNFGFALLGTTMAPGYDHADFVAGTFAELVAQYPDWREELALLTPSQAEKPCTNCT